jgi:hypothetical protein
MLYHASEQTTAKHDPRQTARKVFVIAISAWRSALAAEATQSADHVAPAHSGQFRRYRFSP